MVLYQVCSNGGPRVQNGPDAGGPVFETIEIQRKILKNLLLQNRWAQMLEIWYVALPSGPLPSLFIWWPQGSKMALQRVCVCVGGGGLGFETKDNT